MVTQSGKLPQKQRQSHNVPAQCPGLLCGGVALLKLESGWGTKRDSLNQESHGEFTAETGDKDKVHGCMICFNIPMSRGTECS